MRSRSRTLRSKSSGDEDTKVENQGSFQVFCLAISLGGTSLTEPCHSRSKLHV
jgi:hypothetical protein